MNCVTVIYECTTFGLFVFFPWGIPQLQSCWSLSCDHGLDHGSYCENNNNNSPIVVQFVLFFFWLFRLLLTLSRRTTQLWFSQTKRIFFVMR